MQQVRKTASLDDLNRRLKNKAEDDLKVFLISVIQIREKCASTNNLGGSREAIQLVEAAEQHFRSYCKDAINLLITFANDEGFLLEDSVAAGAQQIYSFLNQIIEELRKKYPSNWSFSGGEAANKRIDELEPKLRVYAEGCIRDAELGVLDGKRIHESPPATTAHHTNPFLRAYAFEKKYNLSRLRITLEKAEKAYQTHQPETIDFCKCALESICREIIREKSGNEVASNSIKFHELVEQALDAVGYQQGKVATSIKGLAHGIADIRNNKTIAGHALNESKPLPTKTEISLFVITFSHLVDILLHLMDEEKIDILHTKMTFGTLESLYNLENINEEIDSQVNVEYSKDDGILFLEGKELRPSEVLFHFDRNAYKSRIQPSLDSENNESLT